MTLALIALVVLAVVIFAFVLEPLLRARGDQAVLDAAALPEHEAVHDDGDANARPAGSEPSPGANGDERHGGRRVPIDRPVGSDAS